MQPPKLLRKTQIHFFPLLPWAAKTEKFMFQIMTYIVTVYRTGVSPIKPCEKSLSETSKGYWNLYHNFLFVI